MNNNDTNTDLLIQYLDGELEGDALTEVQNKISNDPLLQQELERLRSAQQAIKSYGIRQQVSNIHMQMMPEFKDAQKTKAPVRHIMMRAVRVAASIIIIVGLVTLYQYYSLSSGKLFESNYQAYVVHEVRGEDDSSILKQLYKQNLMQEVINKFPTIKQPSAQDYFYLGNAYLHEHKPSLAIKSFQLLQQKNATTNSRLLEDDTEYYLAMSYLQNNEVGKALPIFNEIHNNKQHLYHDKVGSLFLFKVRLLAKK